MAEEKEEILFFLDLLNNKQLQRMTGYNPNNLADLVSMKGFPMFRDGESWL